MPHTYAATMFSDESKKLQERFGSRAQYERITRSGQGEQELGLHEAEFIAARNSFYLATVTPDGWPYIQHRGGPTGFLHVLDERTLAFADYSGNKQFISVGNLATNDRFSIFLMDYPNRTRLKLIGRVRILEPGADPALETRLAPSNPRIRVERIFLLDVVGFDWNCSQHITPRYSVDELETIQPHKRQS